MNLEIIVENCLNEMTNFKVSGVGDSDHCLQLFRMGIQEQNHEAFSAIYSNFEVQIKKWIYAHSKFAQTGEDVEHFVSVTFSKLYHALEGEKFERMQNFASVMKYLRLCVNSVVIDYLRSLPPPTVNIDDISLTVQSTQNDIALEEIWERILTSLPDPEDQLVARKVFIEGYKPAEISQQHPDMFETPRTVSVALQRIRRKLRSDKHLVKLFNIVVD